MTHEETSRVLKIVNYLMEMGFTKMTHQQFAMNLQNGKTRAIYSAGEVGFMVVAATLTALNIAVNLGHEMS